LAILYSHPGTMAQAGGPPLTTTRQSHTDSRAVHLVVKLVLKLAVRWTNAHPHVAFSRFMLKQRGPRTDVDRMSRIQRLASALAFLLWGCLFLGLCLLTGYLTFGLRLLSPDNPVVQVMMFGLPLLAGCGLLGGLYLLVRVSV
jgi:hypothetical protein